MTANTGWRRLDVRMIWVDLVRSCLSAAPTLIAVLVFDVEVSWSTLWPPLIVAALGITGAVEDALRWAKTRYRVGPDLVELRTGFLVRKYRSIRRERIRSVDASAKLRHRITGMRILRVGAGQQTAGSPDSAVELDAVSVADAALLRRELLRDTGLPEAVPAGTVPATVAEPLGAGTGATEDQRGATADPRVAGGPASGHEVPPVPEQRELARIRWSWIVYNMFNVWAYLVALGMMSGAYWMAGSVGVDARGIVTGLVDWERLGPGWSVVLAVLLLGVLGTAGLAAVFVAENWNFRLLRVATENGGQLRTTRGLFSTREIDRDETRLRGVRLNEPLLWRWMGVADTDVISTGLSVWSLDPATTVLPRGPVAVAHRVAADILGSDVLRTPLIAHPPAALRRRLFRASMLVAAVLLVGAMATWWGGLPGWLPWLGLGLLPPAYGLTYAGYRALGHALADDHVVFRSGTLGRATAALRRQAVVGWVFRQSPLQRRLGLMTVSATTAAGYGQYAAPDAAAPDAVRLAVTATPELFGSGAGELVPAGEPLPIDARVSARTAGQPIDHAPRVAGKQDEHVVEGESDRDRAAPAVVD